MLFSGKGRIHLDGHKNLTDSDAPLQLTEFEYVYIPLLNMGSTNFDVHVQEGDQVKVGQMIANRNDHFYVPLFSSVSGTVEKIEKRMSPSLVFCQHIVIKNDMKYDTVEQGLHLDVENATKEEIVEGIKNSGITGCGGSGFPTYIKYCGDGKLETLLVNGVECEPYITTDYLTMKEEADALILGCQFLMKASGTSKAIIAFKKGKVKLKEILSEKIANVSNITIAEVPDVYPMGWERTLVNEVFNVTYDKIPSEKGIVVNNSTTVINVAKALTNGLEHVTRLTVSGNAIKNPRNVIVPTGAKVVDIVNALGGYDDSVVDNNTLLVMGGPMMGKAVTTDEVSLTSYSNAVNLLFVTDLREKACLRCSRCISYCPSGLQPVAIKDAEKAQNVELLQKLHADNCVSCGLCSYVCPSRIQVTDYTTKGKTRVLGAKK